jgi:hypothetical protein
MVQVLNRGESFVVRLACTICGERGKLGDLWLAFPPGEDVEGQWTHRRCVEGRVESAFGTKRLVLMNGHEALKRLAGVLDDSADVSLVKRPKAGRRLPWQGEAAHGVQRHAYKARTR